VAATLADTRTQVVILGGGRARSPRVGKPPSALKGTDRSALGVGRCPSGVCCSGRCTHEDGKRCGHPLGNCPRPVADLLGGHASSPVGEHLVGVELRAH